MKFELVKPKTKVEVLASMGALAIGLAASGPVAAQVTQSAETMSMEQAVLAAVQVHPSIRGARAQELQAAEAVDVASLRQGHQESWVRHRHDPALREVGFTCSRT